jgi:hypothetical protein
MESRASVHEQRCGHGEQGDSNDRVGHGMLGEPEPVRDIGEHHVPAPVEHRLDRTAVRQACERERRDADHDQRAQQECEHPYGRSGNGGGAVEWDVVWRDCGWY